MFVFGGQNSLGYMLNLKTFKWEKLNVARYENGYHTANILGDTIYLIGGYLSNSENFLQTFNVEDETL